jgi:hypothetical protein
MKKTSSGRNNAAEKNTNEAIGRQCTYVLSSEKAQKNIHGRF